MSIIPNNQRQQVGRDAESLACRFLEERKYQILGRNWRRPWGEIDIIAQKGDVITFIEVKGASENRTGFEAWRRANHTKLKKVSRTAQTWMAHRGVVRDTSWQIDVIQIGIDEKNDNAHVIHFKNVLL